MRVCVSPAGWKAAWHGTQTQSSNLYGSRSRKRRIISQKIAKAPSESSDESDSLFAAAPCTTRSCNSDAPPPLPPLSVVGLNDSDGAEEMVGEEVGA